MYDPNNIVVGVTILFLIGYAFFIIRKMYTKKINELEKINEQQRIMITNQQNVELKRSSDISNNFEVTKERSTHESTFEDTISNVPTSTVDVIIEDNGYDMSNYSEDLDKSDIRKVVENIIANTEQYTINEVVNVEEENDVEEVEEVEEVEDAEEVDDAEEVNEIDEIDEIDETTNIRKNSKDSESELESYSEKEINNLKVMELKEILDKHGKSYTSDLKKKDLKEIVLSLTICTDS